MILAVKKWYNVRVMLNHVKAIKRLLPLVLSAICPCATMSAETITSVSQVRALADEDYSRETPFCITGLVTTSSRKGCLLDAADGSCNLWITNMIFKKGDIIRADGYTTHDFFANDPILCATNTVKLGHGTIPEPQLLTIGDVLIGKGDYKRIRLRGFFTDAFNDDIDDNYVIALFNVGGHILHTAAPKDGNTLERLRSIIDADIELTCTCSPWVGGKRLFGGPLIRFNSASKDIKVLSRSANDPFAAPRLKILSRTFAENISALKRHSLQGCVLAAWQKRNLLVKYGTNLIAKITLAEGERLPEAGTGIEAVGFPETDLFTVNLANARIRPAEKKYVPAEAPTDVSACRINHQPFTKRYDLDFYGHLVRFAGIVRAISRPQGEPGRLTIESDGILVPIDAGTSADALDKVEIGCRIEVTGVCVMESESWRPQRIVPTITGFFLVIRSPDDIRILSYPPWWTPQRFLFALSGLLLVLVTILVWNIALRRLVERRSRELIKSQAAKLKSDLRIDERTRIAAELHDYLAQNLTAMSYQLTAARLSRDEDPATSQKHLETVATMLNSSRTELRRCLWDLKSEALEEPTFEQAIRRTLQQILDGTPLSISFEISRRSVNDSTAHAILSVIRELVANAIRHGHAKSIVIKGEHDDGRLKVSVIDDGIGFDPSSCFRSDEGHFGLDGIRNRIGRLGGEFTLTSSPGYGTTAEIFLTLQKTPSYKTEQT